MTAEGIDRRAFLGAAAGLGAALALEAPALAWGTSRPRPPEALPPGKRGLLLRSSRPLDLETPVSLLGDAVTPTERFFVRSHHDEPRLDAAKWRLKVVGPTGEIALSLADLRALPARL